MNILWIAFSICLSSGLTSAQDDSKGYFWILNDLHYDPTYWTLQGSCNMNVSDPGKYGDHLCDPPWELVESAVKALEYHGREPEFIVLLGDNPPHLRDKSLLTEELKLDIIKNITLLIEDTFQGIPIIPVMGNHDFYPKDQLPGGSSSFYDKLAEMWDPWFNDTDITDKFKEGGFYMKRVSARPVVWAMVLNTNLYSTSNDAAPGDDPGGQFQWAEQHLTQARNRGEKVHMFLHIPPGMLELEKNMHFFRDDHNTRFHQLLQEYADVLLGMHTGHSHFDTFKMIHNKDDGAAVCSIFVSPSVTPWMSRLPGDRMGQPHNPAVRKVWYWHSNHSLNDYEQFYLDLNRANDQEDDNWMRLYSYKLKYKVHDISPHSIQSVLDDFKTYGSAAFHEYYELNSVSISEGLVPCGCACKNQHVCAIEFVDFTDYQACADDPTYACGAMKNCANCLLAFLSYIVYKHLFV